MDRQTLHAKTLRILTNDPFRRACLEAAQEANLPQAYLAAGFVRNAIWDFQHGTKTPLNDVDLVYFDERDCTAEHDRELEARLSRWFPEAPWEVRNQARMHARHGHRPYRSTRDAVGRWPEVPTCVGVRLEPGGYGRIIAPFGLGESWNLTIRPNPRVTYPLDIMRGRIRSKGWLWRWPMLRVLISAGSIDDRFVAM